MDNFLFKSRPAMASAVAAFVVTALASSVAFGQQAASAEKKAAENTDEMPVVIIGSRRINRSVTDSASPIDVIGGSDLVEQPAINLLEAIRNVVPSFYVSQATIADASTFVRTLAARVGRGPRARDD